MSFGLKCLDRKRPPAPSAAIIQDRRIRAVQDVTLALADLPPDEQEWVLRVVAENAQLHRRNEAHLHE